VNITEITLIFVLRSRIGKDLEARGCCPIEEFCRLLPATTM